MWSEILSEYWLKLKYWQTLSDSDFLSLFFEIFYKCNKIKIYSLFPSTKNNWQCCTRNTKSDFETPTVDHCVYQQPWNSVVNTFKISNWFPLGFCNGKYIEIQWNNVIQIELASCSNRERPNRKNCTPAIRFHVEIHSL